MNHSSQQPQHLTKHNNMNSPLNNHTISQSTTTWSIPLNNHNISGVDPGFQVRGAHLKKIAPSGGRR
jgi:hypothetical protein